MLDKVIEDLAAEDLRANSQYLEHKPSISSKQKSSKEKGLEEPVLKSNDSSISGPADVEENVAVA